jgi:hypothetical protein
MRFSCSVTSTTQNKKHNHNQRMEVWNTLRCESRGPHIYKSLEINGRLIRKAKKI